MSDFSTDTFSSTSPSFLWIGDYGKEKSVPEFNTYSSVESGLKENEEIDVVVLSLPMEEQDRALTALRSSSKAALSCIYTVNPSPLSECLSNGIFDNDVLSKKYSHYRKRKRSIKFSNSDLISHRLLSFLYIFPDCDLKAISSPENPELYTYPLLQSFGQPSRETWVLIEQLYRQNLIETQTLIDRIRQCKKCNSGHVNYIDLCPHCRSIDIEMRTSLHCFNCGNVDRQEMFSRGGNLICPNCLQQLRHIGVDYDRPIENQHCNSCNSFFIESKVEAQCLSCGQEHQVDDLKVRRIESFSLSAAGRDYVLNGVLQNMLSSLGEHMNRSQFLWLVQWNNHVAQRHGHEHVLIALSPDYENLETMDEAIVSQMDSVKERLLNIIRVTDACNSNDSQGILLLLAFTNQQHLPVLKNKLSQLVNSISDESFSLKIKVIPLPDKTLTSDVEAWLSSKLEHTEAI